MNKTGIIAFDWSGTISDDRVPVYFTNLILFLKDELNPYKDKFPSFEEWINIPAGNFFDFLTYLGIDVSGREKELKKKWTEWYESLVSIGLEPEIYPGAKELLDSLNDYKIVVVSSHPLRELKKESENYGIEVSMLISTANKKTALEGLRKTFGEFPYIGDMFTDAKAAEEAGVPFIGVSWGYQPKILENNGIKVVSSFDELKKEIDKYFNKFKN